MCNLTCGHFPKDRLRLLRRSRLQCGPSAAHLGNCHLGKYHWELATWESIYYHRKTTLSQSINKSINKSTYLFIFLFIYLTIHLSIYSSIYLCWCCLIPNILMGWEGMKRYQRGPTLRINQISGIQIVR